MIVKYALIVLTCVLAMTGIAFLRKIKFLSFTSLSIDQVAAFLTQTPLWIGIAFSGLTFLLYVWLLSKYETSSIVPILFGVNLIVLSVYSIFIFGEGFSLQKGLGYLLIFGGLWMLS